MSDKKIPSPFAGSTERKEDNFVGSIPNPALAALPIGRAETLPAHKQASGLDGMSYLGLMHQVPSGLAIDPGVLRAFSEWCEEHGTTADKKATELIRSFLLTARLPK
jgi:hypothetical protein